MDSNYSDRKEGIPALASLKEPLDVEGNIFYDKVLKTNE